LEHYHHAAESTARKYQLSFYISEEITVAAPKDGHSYQLCNACLVEAHEALVNDFAVANVGFEKGFTFRGFSNFDNESIALSTTSGEIFIPEQRFESELSDRHRKRFIYSNHSPPV
jgi:hypothetical protein